MTRVLRPDAWSQENHELVTNEVVERCKHFFPELVSWPEQALVNAYKYYWQLCNDTPVTPPTGRDIDFLIVLYVLAYQVPDAREEFMIRGEPLMEGAEREIESLWLGEPIIH